MSNYDFEDQRQAIAVLDRYQNGWQPPQTKRVFTPPKNPSAVKRYEEMSISELEEILKHEESVLAQQYGMHKDMPDLGIGADLKKMVYKISLIKSAIAKIDPSRQVVPVAKVAPVDKDKTKAQAAHLAKMNDAFIKKNQEIADLNKRIVGLTRENKEYQSLTRMELANNREVKIHIEFKQLVKKHIGVDKYLELITAANDLVDNVK